MGNKRGYDVIGLVAAIALYLLVLLAVSGVLFRDHEKKDYGYNVEDAVVVDIDRLLPKTKPAPKPKQKPPTPKPKTTPLQPPQPQIQPPQPPKPLSKEEKNEPKPKDSRDKTAKSAKDLFSTIRTDAFKKAMEEKRKQEAARASRLKKRKAEEARKRAEELKRRRAQARRAQQLIEQIQQRSQARAHKKRGEEHDFWSPVANKIMAKWNRTISTQDGLKADVRIRIDNHGRLTYRILRLSDNDLFNTKLKVFLDNLAYERFPAYKKGSYIEATFEFADKER